MDYFLYGHEWALISSDVRNMRRQNTTTLGEEGQNFSEELEEFYSMACTVEIGSTLIDFDFKRGNSGRRIFLASLALPNGADC